MCGLVGIAGDLEYRDEEAMKRLLVLDSHRGLHATGLAAVRKSGKVEIAKTSSHPFDLFDMNKFKSALVGASSCAFIGHNRLATRGENVTANAHPFQFDHIVGAHNGTLDHWSQKDLEKELGETFDVDSKAIFAAIAKLGIEETVKLLQGSYCITYFNLKDGTMNFLRNKERPLWMSFSKDAKIMFWASEYPTIFASLYKNSTQYRESYFNKDGHRFFSFDEDIHYSYAIEDLVKGKGERPKAKVKKMEGRNFSRQAQQTGSKNGSGEQGNFRNVLSRLDEMREKKAAENAGKVNNVLLFSDEPLAGRFTESQFEEMVGKVGCQWCGRAIPFGTRGIAVYARDGIVFCPEHAAHAFDGKTRLYTLQMPLEKTSASKSIIDATATSVN